MKIQYLGRKTKRKEFVLAVARWYARELGLDRCRRELLIVGPEDVDFDTDEAHGATSMEGGDIFMYIDPKLAMEPTLQVIAHEMVHVRQYALGHLKRVEVGGVSRARWMGRLVREDVPYLDLPWERQAFGQQALLAAKFGEMVKALAANQPI